MSIQPGSLSRRTLLVGAAQAAGLAVGALSCGRLFASPGSREFKIGTLDGCLGKQSDPAAFEIAKAIGFDGVQIDMGGARNNMHLRRPEVQEQYRKAAQRTGLAIASMTITKMLDVPLKSDPRAAPWLGESVDICQALGLKVVLVPQFNAGELDLRRPAEIDYFIRALKAAAPKAEKAGVTFGLENYLSARDNMRILDRIGSPAVKVYYDVGNSTDKHYDIYEEIPLLGPLICEFHFKDGQFVLGQGRIDFRRVRQALDKIHYSGWIQIEAAAPHGIVEDYKADLRFLRGLFPRRVE
jgi:sugar phosphate isomerase/epimerase